MLYKNLKRDIINIIPRLIDYEDIDECEDNIYDTEIAKLYCFIRIVRNFIIDYTCDEKIIIKLFQYFDELIDKYEIMYEVISLNFIESLDNYYLHIEGVVKDRIDFIFGLYSLKMNVIRESLNQSWSQL